MHEMPITGGGYQVMAEQEQDLYVGDGFTWSGVLIAAVKAMTDEERGAWVEAHPGCAPKVLAAIANAAAEGKL
jgi:hypothetical protein